MTEILRYSAFAASPRGGNPAGVVLDAGDLSDDEMLHIAQEVGYAETAFVTARDGSDITVRFFSPAAEVPFCGHATVATAVALAEREALDALTVHTAAGVVELTATGAGGDIEVSFASVQPEVRDIEPETLDELLTLLGLRAEDLDDRYPPRESFAGNWHPVIVVADRDEFFQFTFDPQRLAAAMRRHEWRGTVTVLHALAADEFEARNLFPVGRISEDPATGSAAASTGAYLRSVVTACPASIVIHQGDSVGRPSILRVAIPDAGAIVVTGGAVRIPE